MKRAVPYLSVFSLLALTAWFADPFALRLFAYRVGFCLLLPAALLATFLIWRAGRLGHSAGRAVKTLRLLAGAAVFLGVALPLNHYVFQQAVIEAKAWGDSVLPLLEAHRRQHGAYPRTLEELPSLPPLPRLMTFEGYGYSERTFTLWFSDPTGGVFDAWVYDSLLGRWHHSG